MVNRFVKQTHFYQLTFEQNVSEALVNSFGGYPGGYGLGLVILPLSAGWIQSDPVVATTAITGVYATVSFVRSYFLRRVFEKYGIDDNVLKIGIKFVKKTAQRGK